MQFGGLGGDCAVRPPNVVRNEWDFIRYGTIQYGERIVACDPPVGFVNRDRYTSVDRFTVTFDSGNYVYVGEIDVQVTGGVAPSVTQTRRLDNGPPEVVEIVLDRPIPANARTRFTFNDGAIVQSVSYTYLLGDVDADDDHDLADFAALANCTAQESAMGQCRAFDFNTDGHIDAGDYAAFLLLFSA